MRIKLMLATLLFLLPSNICGSKEIKNTNIETENMPNIYVSNGQDIEQEDKISRHVVKTGVLTDDNDYNRYPPCGDKPMS